MLFRDECHGLVALAAPRLRRWSQREHRDQTEQKKARPSSSHETLPKESESLVHRKSEANIDLRCVLEIAKFKGLPLIPGRGTSHQSLPHALIHRPIGRQDSV